ncbi:hypothetical protein DL96DRAFT_905596 [Flagelloscypha sp. PMI_526]|nr:hypothetical protein DL96DRAFT_905596 [Flagelloscypha sp. PMI_526]
MSATQVDGLKVLTLDGEADIRVGMLSALYALLHMMRGVAWERPDLTADEKKKDSSNDEISEALPCKCFDLIVGSGDGGWIAIMLGRLNMSTTQVINTYCRIRESVHDSYPSSSTSVTWDKAAKAEIFEACLKLLVEQRVGTGDSEQMFERPSPSCRVMALAVYRENDAPYAASFRNYIPRKNDLGNYPIWFAMRAAASSTIFPPAQLNPTKPPFLSASELKFNNPVDQAISEAIGIAENLQFPISCLISLGAGHPGVEAHNESELGETTIRLAKDPARAHDLAFQRFDEASKLNPETYFRVNVEQGFQRPLFQEITPMTIRTHTEMYLRRANIDQSMKNMVQILAGTVATRAVAPFGVDTLPIQDSVSPDELMHIYAHELYPLGYGLRKLLFYL